MDENTDEDTASQTTRRTPCLPQTFEKSQKHLLIQLPLPLDDDFTPSSRRRSSHVAGYNRKTGEPTLVGIYPPCLCDEEYIPVPLRNVGKSMGKIVNGVLKMVTSII